MKAEDVSATRELALTASDCRQTHVRRSPRLPSGNDSSYISEELADWLGEQRMSHVPWGPYHPQTQGGIAR